MGVSYVLEKRDYRIAWRDRARPTNAGSRRALIGIELKEGPNRE